jgi:NAD(P)-dependent dehydrogenase (short-subunit alcohol dehydrogenase family)
MAKQSVLVVGASRGLGLALAAEFCLRHWNVVGTSRSHSASLDKLSERHPGALEVESVDIVKLPSVRDLRRRLEGRTFDVVFINAGVCRANELTPSGVDEKDFLDMMLTNALSPMRVVEVFHDIVAENGVIAVMSSEIGSIANCDGFWELYSSSKAALNLLMKAFGARHPKDPRAFLLVAPGWVRTEMGGAEATLEISDSIPLVVDVIERNAGVPGVRFIDRHGGILPW